MKNGHVHEGGKVERSDATPTRNLAIQSTFPTALQYIFNILGKCFHKFRVRRLWMVPKTKLIQLGCRAFCQNTARYFKRKQEIFLFFSFFRSDYGIKPELGTITLCTYISTSYHDR